MTPSGRGQGYTTGRFAGLVEPAFTGASLLPEYPPGAELAESTGKGGTGGKGGKSGKGEEYGGGRESLEIVEWCRRRSGQLVIDDAVFDDGYGEEEEDGEAADPRDDL